MAPPTVAELPLVQISYNLDGVPRRCSTILKVPPRMKGSRRAGARGRARGRGARGAPGGALAG